MKSIYNPLKYSIGIVFLVVLFFYCNGSKSYGASFPIALSDTVKPKVKKYLTLPYDINTFNNKLDTLQKIGGLLGKSLTVDQSDVYKNYLFGILNSFFRDVRQDSVIKK